MWGNALGWSISAVLVACTLYGVHLIDLAGRISGPTDFATNPAHLAPLALPVSPQAVFSFSDSSDSGPLYRQAFDEYRADRARYDAFADHGKAEDLPRLPALQTLVRAAASSRGRLFIDRPAEIVDYSNEHPALDALRMLGSLATRAGLLLQKSDPASAAKYHGAAFSLGAKLFDERLTAQEMLAGLELMSTGAAGLSRVAEQANDRARVASLASFDAGRREYYNTAIQPMLRVLTSVDDATITRHAGDYFYLAQHAGDRVWRVEAILALGRLRFFVGSNGRIGDQRGAMKTLKQLSTAPDPVIRTAATAGQDLTLEQYRQIR